MTLDPAISALDWIIMGVCAGAALVLCLIGALRLVPKLRFLQRRLELYKYLPVVRALEESRARIELTTQKAGEASLLLGRAQAALTKIQIAVAGLVETATAVSNAITRVSTAVARVMRFFGHSSKALRSRGS